MNTAALLTLVLPLAAQLGAPRADAEVIAPLQCFVEPGPDGVDLENVADKRIAVVGSTWWVPRFSESGVVLFAELDNMPLHDENGSPVTTQVRRSFAGVAVTVPTDAIAGERYDLLAGDTVVAELSVAVGTPERTDGELSDFEVAAGGPQTCEVFCEVEGLTIPSRPLLRFTQTGGPYVVDAFAVPEGDMEPLTDRMHRADSVLLDAVAEPTVVELELDDIGWNGALDVYVTVRDAHDLSSVTDEMLAVAPLGEEPADTTDVSPCLSGGGGTSVGCPFFGGSFVALLFVPALAVRLRRRRADGGRT